MMEHDEMDRTHLRMANVKATMVSLDRRGCNLPSPGGGEDSFWRDIVDARNTGFETP